MLDKITLTIEIPPCIASCLYSVLTIEYPVRTRAETQSCQKKKKKEKKTSPAVTVSVISRLLTSGIEQQKQHVGCFRTLHRPGDYHQNNKISKLSEKTVKTPQTINKWITAIKGDNSFVFHLYSLPMPKITNIFS